MSGSLWLSWPYAEQYLQRTPGSGQILEVPDIERLGGAPPLKVYVLRHMFLLGPKGVIATRSGSILRETTLYSNSEAAMCPITEGPQFKSGAYVALHGVWSDGFWHWMLEFLPKVIMAERAGFQGTYILPQGVPFAEPSLRLLGIPSSRMITHDGGSWLVETLFLPQCVLASGHARELTQTIANYPGLLTILREEMLHRAVKKQVGERLYISRREAKNGRRVINEEELLKLLRRWDFTEVITEALPLAEQIGVFPSANVVVGPHGAGMLHTLFMPKSSLVVEIFPPTYVNPCVLAIMNVMRHRYHMAVSPMPDTTPYKYGTDVVANLDVVETVLEVALG